MAPPLHRGTWIPPVEIGLHEEVEPHAIIVAAEEMAEEPPRGPAPLRAELQAECRAEQKAAGRPYQDTGEEHPVINTRVQHCGSPSSSGHHYGMWRSIVASSQSRSNR